MRETDKCLVKRLYAKFTPYVQFGGWLALAIPAGFSLVVLIQKAQAFDGRLTAMEQAQLEYTAKQDVLIGKLDTVLYFVRKK